MLRAYFLPMATEQDCYIVTSQTGDRRSPWRWDIKRQSRPMGVKLGAGGYQTQLEAERAGRQVLADLLQKIAREEPEH